MDIDNPERKEETSDGVFAEVVGMLRSRIKDPEPLILLRMIRVKQQFTGMGEQRFLTPEHVQTLSREIGEASKSMSDLKTALDIANDNLSKMIKAPSVPKNKKRGGIKMSSQLLDEISESARLRDLKLQRMGLMKRKENEKLYKRYGSKMRSTDI